jgi:hypothetical protein
MDTAISAAPAHLPTAEREQPDTKTAIAIVRYGGIKRLQRSGPTTRQPARSDPETQKGQMGRPLQSVRPTVAHRLP